MLTPSLPPAGPPAVLPPKKRSLGSRLTSVPAIIFMVIAGIVVLTAAYNVYKRGQDEQRMRELASAPPAGADPRGFLKDQPTGYIKPSAYRLGPQPSAIGPSAEKVKEEQKQAEEDNGREKFRQERWKQHWAEYAEVMKAHFDDRKKALAEKDSTVPIKLASTEGTPAGAGAAAPAAPSFPSSGGAQNGFGGTPALWGGGGFGGWGGFGGGTPQIDRQGQQDKIAFAGQQGDLGKNDVVPTVRKPPDPLAVEAGSFVKFTTITESNSDIPGSQVGMVTEDVYNHDGTCVLIPQNTKLIGHYSTMVSTGQDRLPVVLTRINFPDGSHQSIGAMEGADNAGSAGQEDQVNYHLVQKFGAVFLASLPAAALQLSQPHNNSINGYDAQQVLAGTLGLQMAQLAQEIARQQLSIPNTITIRAGYNGTMINDKDIHISPPWSCHGRRGGFLPIMQASQ